MAGHVPPPRYLTATVGAICGVLAAGFLSLAALCVVRILEAPSEVELWIAVLVVLIFNAGLAFGVVARHLLFPRPSDARSRLISPTSWRIGAAAFFALGATLVIVGLHTGTGVQIAAAVQSAVIGGWCLEAARQRARLRERLERSASLDSGRTMAGRSSA
jgi:hypothetical protein